MATDLTSFIDLYRAFIGDDEDLAYNTTSLTKSLAMGAIEAGYTLTSSSPPTISNTVDPYSITGLTIIAWAARAMLMPRAQVKSFSAGSPRRSFNFENIDGAVKRAISFIRDNDPNVVLPSDDISDIYAILQTGVMLQDTVDDALSE